MIVYLCSNYDIVCLCVCDGFETDPHFFLFCFLIPKDYFVSWVHTEQLLEAGERRKSKQ